MAFSCTQPEAAPFILGLEKGNLLLKEQTMAKILITEDDLGIQKLYRETLLGEGFDVRTVENGEDALTQVSTFKPDVILLDLDMPIMDGEVFLKNLYEKFPKEEIPKIVIFTNWQTRKPAELVEQYNLSGFFVKLKASLVDVIDNLRKLSNDEEVDWMDVM